MPVGQIVSLAPEKGFGFIKPTGGGGDLFFHNSVVDCPIESLKVGQEVEYEVDAEAKKARAKSVTVRGGSSQNDRQRGRTLAATRRSPRPQHNRPRMEPAVKTECGFVTKLLWKKSQGFISADTGGAELLFDQSDVSGEKRFQQMKIGDYVRFVRNPSAAKNPIHEPPTARAVQVIERVPQKLPSLELPSNPKARHKKPTWR